MDNVLKFMGENKDIILFVIGIIILIIKNIMNGKTFKNALIIAINSMKDESKMKDDKFDISLTEKAKEINELHVGDAKAYKQFKDIIEKMNKKEGLKIGSYKGKPIYANEAIGILGMLSGFLKKK